MKMKITFFCKTVILFGVVLFFSCAQDPIFFTISTEPVPEKPRIQGSPTNMAVFKRNNVSLMYVASGSLHWYGKTGWDSEEYRIPQPGGKIIGLAATNDHLYALSISDLGVSTILRRIGTSDGDWQDIINKSQYTLIQSIFADKDKLFAGAMNNNGSDFGIFYLDDTSTNPNLILINGLSGTEMLSGAASRDGFHYLSTRGKGVYKVAADISSVVQLADIDNMENEGKKNRLFMGMIQLEDGLIIVVERSGGAFFEVLESGFKILKYSDGKTVATGKYSTGALALWRQVIYDENQVPDYKEGKKMLVAGIQGGLYSSTTTSSSYTHGYVEFELNPDGSLNFIPVSRDISPNITVDGNTDRYTATIGKHPINYLYQTPSEVDANMTFFASTQTAGLWSYRNRTGGLQWNAEN